MTKTTFHTHSRFDDGQEELESYIKAALEKNFQVFGFSAHAPVNFESDWHMKQECFDEYVDTTKLLKEKYKNDIEIYTGLEADYYDGCIDWRKTWRRMACAVVRPACVLSKSLGLAISMYQSQNSSQIKL